MVFQDPAEQHRFCYIAKLIINDVESSDKQFRLTATNTAGTKTFNVYTDISGRATSLIFDVSLCIVLLTLLLFKSAFV